MVFVIHWHESAMDLHVLPILIPLPPPSPPDSSGSSQCTRPEHLSHAPAWAGDLFHPRWYTCFDAVLSKYPTLSFFHRVQNSFLYICVSFSVLHIGLLLPSFKVPYICISILYWSLSFWLTSLCMMGSSDLIFQNWRIGQVPHDV